MLFARIEEIDRGPADDGLHVTSALVNGTSSHVRLSTHRDGLLVPPRTSSQPEHVYKVLRQALHRFDS